MTVKEVKAYLKQYRAAEKIAGRLKTEYEEQMLLIDNIKSPSNTDGMPRGSGISNRTEQRALRLVEAAERYKDAEVEALKKRQQVFDLIWNVPGLKGEILYLRYIKLKSWDQVANMLHYSLQHIHRLHGEILLELSNMDIMR